MTSAKRSTTDGNEYASVARFQEDLLPYDLRSHRRRARIVAFEAALAPCEWCGRGLGVSSIDHAGCRKALER